jgi:peptidoglycan-associated lipoprotein
MFRRLISGLFVLNFIACALFLPGCAGNKASTSQTPSAAVSEETPSDTGVLPAEEESLATAASTERPPGWQAFLYDDVYFKKGSAALQPEATDKLKQKAEWLQENLHINVVIQGHSDESGTAEYNFALADRRAGNVKSYLIGLGIAPSRMAVVSYGKEQPAVAGDPAKNRRVHFEIESLD